jgi:hypothetical protein
MIGWLGSGACRNMSSSSSVSGGGGRGGGTSPPGRGGLGGAYSVMNYIRFTDLYSANRITGLLKNTISTYSWTHRRLKMGSHSKDL